MTVFYTCNMPEIFFDKIIYISVYHSNLNFIILNYEFIQKKLFKINEKIITRRIKVIANLSRAPAFR